MKQFSLEEFKKNPNRKVVTRDRKNVRIICTDAKGDYPVIGLIRSLDNEDYPWRFRIDGAILENEENENDLFFDTVTNDGWVNLYRTKSEMITFGYFRKTIEDAVKEIDNKSNDCRHIATVKLTWEE